MIFSGVTALIPHMRSGRLRAIAIGSLQRFPAIAEVPTFDESGLKGFEAITWFGLVAPARTPKEIVARWNDEVGRLLASPDIRERFMNDGQEPMGGPPDEFARFIGSEIAKYAKVIKAAGLKQQ
jgi:tripartite-type tricarboxylate transporter receptor subunit TctC